jgi:hypothetical protein
MIGMAQVQRNSSKEKGDEPTTYQLRFELKNPVSENRTGGGQKYGQGGVRKSDTQTTVGQTTVNNTVNGVVKGGGKSTLHQLLDLGDPPEKAEYIARDIILKALGDEKSLKFYELVAAKVPESVIREVLAEVRADGARSPAKLFTYKIKQYVIERSRGEFEKRKQGLLHGM